MRTPLFELHIQPMFRITDREHMRGLLDLTDYDTVVANAEAISSRLRVDMPPPATGGLWPEEWIALFDRWRDEGFKRLALGQGTFSIQASGLASALVATGTKPGDDVHVWLQVEQESDVKVQFVLYMEVPGAAAPAVPYTTRERIRSGDNRSISVRDATGITVVR
jgi:hypothetical protein